MAAEHVYQAAVSGRTVKLESFVGDHYKQNKYKTFQLNTVKAQN